jgi:hypothetical protein
MAAVDRLSGDRGQIKIDPAGGAALVTVASVSKWSLNMAKDYYNVTAFGDANKVWSPGLADISGNLEAFGDMTDKTLFNVALGTTAATLALYVNTLLPTHYWKGLAWLDSAIDVGQGGAITVKSNFKAAGAWSMFP